MTSCRLGEPVQPTSLTIRSIKSFLPSQFVLAWCILFRTKYIVSTQNRVKNFAPVIFVIGSFIAEDSCQVLELQLLIRATLNESNRVHCTTGPCGERNLGLLVV